MSDSEMYDEDYFLRGRQSGKSLYENYRWLPDLTIPMVGRIIEHLGIQKTDHILDFGCARGYMVRAFRELGYTACGYDISEWAVRNPDDGICHYLTSNYVTALGPSALYSWVIAKDVLEHVLNVEDTISDIMAAVTRGVLVVVPLSAIDHRPYVIESYEWDVTHVHRLTLPTWAGMFMRPGWEVTASYRIAGVKDNYWKVGMEAGNGFIVARRVQG
jgi:hypothetical protein